MCKLYKYAGATLLFVICFSIGMLATIGFVALEAYFFAIHDKDIWGVVIASLMFLILFSVILYAFITKLPIPIYVTDEKVRHGKVEYKWGDIKITAVPVNTRYYIYYMLLLRTEYIHDIKTCKKEMRKGLCVIPSQRTLNILLPHYNDKVLVLDSYGDEIALSAIKKRANQMIISHNAKISCHSETTDCEANSSLPV